MSADRLFEIVSRTLRWVLIIVIAFGLSTALLLNYLNPAKFTFLKTFLAIGFYVVLMLLLFRLTMSPWKSFSEKIENKFGKIFDQILGHVLLVLMCFLSGSMAGAFWWVIQGSDVITIQTAIFYGGLIGCLPLILLAG